MINLVETPQRADIKAIYQVNNDVLTVTIDDISEAFDFTGLEEGVAEEITSEILPINPILRAEKIDDIVTVKAIRFYSANEKEQFEGGVVSE